MVFSTVKTSLPRKKTSKFFPFSLELAFVLWILTFKLTFDWLKDF